MAARLAHAALELRVAAAATLAVGVLRSAEILAGADARQARALGIGLLVSVVVLWGLWGARVVRVAIRLAMPARARWQPEAATATVTRVLVLQAVPLCALAVVAAPLAERWVDHAGALGAGALIGAGLTALMGAVRVTRAERARGRRLLRDPRWGALMRRSSLYLEPIGLSDRATAPPAAPWPAHRPPARPQRSAIELDPSNPAARHPVGVRGRPAPAPRAGEPPA
jgi:hypothetical protein